MEVAYGWLTQAGLILTPHGLESIRVKGIAESIRKTLAYV